jgi:hypothetical protein
MKENRLYASFWLSNVGGDVRFMVVVGKPSLPELRASSLAKADGQILTATS